MTHLPQSLNQGRAVDVSAFNAGLVATPFTGSTNTSVLLWDPANQALTGADDFRSVENSATLGTSVTLTRKGVYLVELNLAVTADAAALVAGISQDGTDLNTDILITDAGALDATGLITNATDLTNVKLTTMAFVAPEQQIAGSVIRFHASAGDAAPAIMLTQATSWYRVRWLYENNI